VDHRDRLDPPFLVAYSVKPGGFARLGRGRRLVAGLLSLVLITAACSPGGNHKGSTPVKADTTTAPPTTLAVRKGGTLTYAAPQEPTGFNVNTASAYSATTRDIMDQLWPSVFHVAPDFSVVRNKDLMLSAEMTSVNPQVVVMKINPLATWSDGLSITADDFVYFWQQQRDPQRTTDSCTDQACTTAGKPIDDLSDGTGYRNIASVTGSNGGTTVTVVFSKPFADWKSLWSHIVPAHLAQRVGWNKGFDRPDPNVVVSGGPFKIGRYEKGTELTLVPNDKYWAAGPNLDALIFNFIPDRGQQIAAIQNKQVDLIYSPPASDLFNAVDALGSVVSESNLGAAFERLNFNLKSPGLDEPVIRKAIATAVDRPGLIQATIAQFTPKAKVNNNRIFVNGQSQYQDNSAGLYDHGDVATAKALIQQDGYRLGRDGIFAKAGRRLSFRIAATNDDALGKAITGLLAANLKLAGIELKIGTTTGASLLHHDFDMAVLTSIASAFPSVANPFFEQAGAGNYGQGGNAVVDGLLEAGASELDAKQQAADYNAADVVMWQNLWSLPLFQKPTFLAVRTTFVNVHDNATAEGPFWDAQNWGSLFPGSPH
jgi:peptide/nickel transport system substrate-binding protein